MTNKRRLSLKYLLALLPIAAFGVSGVAQAADPVTLEVTEWHTMEEQFDKPFRDIVEDFEAQNPDIKIKIVGLPWLDTLNTLVVRSAANQMPDVALLSDVWVPTLKAMGALRPLQDLVPPETLKEMDWAKGTLLDPVTDADGNIAALPWYAFGFGLIYNKDLLEKAGISGPPATWSEFKDDILKVSALGDDIFGFGANFTNGSGAGDEFFRWLWAHGGEIFDDKGNIAFNSPAGVAALTDLKSLHDANASALTVGIDNYAAREVFAKGKVGFIEDAAWIRPILRSLNPEGEKFDASWGVAAWPKSDATGKSVPLVGAHYWAITQQSKHPEESMRFINFMISNRQHQEEWAALFGSTPVFGSQQDLALFKTDPYFATFSKAIATGKTIPMHPQESVIAGHVANAIQGVFNGADPKSALDEAAAAAEREIAK